MIRLFGITLTILFLYSCSTAQVGLNECKENQTCLEWNEVQKNGLHLKLSDSSLAVIEKVRLEAIRRNKLMNKGYSVPGVMVCGDKKLDVSVRLKGDHTDHLKGNRWSFRVKTKNKSKVFGERKFSIQGVHTRSNINEWIFHELLGQEGIVRLQYDFIPFGLNDIDSLKGTYAFESHFQSNILAIQNKELGPIIKFNEDLFWDYDYRKGEHNRDSIVMLESKLKLTNKKGFSKKLGKKALSLLDAYRKGEVPAKKVFDLKKVATYIAINELVASTHAIRWHNVRYYYNPKTKLFEPVGFDCGTWFGQKGAWGLSYKGMEAFYKGLYDEPEFVKLVHSESERLSKKEFLDKFFSKNEDEIKERVLILQKEDPKYRFWKVAYYNCQKKLREELPNE